MERDLSQRLNRLFDFKHRYSEPVLTNDEVASALMPLGVEITGEALEKARYPGTPIDALDSEMRDALCEFFRVSSVYLRDGTDDPRLAAEIQGIDERLEMWSIARDLGLEHLAARAGDDERVVTTILNELRAIRTNDQHDPLRL